MTSGQGGGSARERHWTCAERLRERRRQLALTQVDVVTRLRERGAGLTNRTLSAMENGRGLDLGMLPDLAAVLDCSITYLLGLADDPSDWQPDQPLCPDHASAAVGTVGTVGTAAAPAGRGSTCNSWILGPDVPDAPPRSSGRRSNRAPT